MRFTVSFLLLCICSSVCLSNPPSVDFPKESKATSDYVIIAPKTDAKTITYVKGFYNNGVAVSDGVEPFPSAMLKDAKIFMLPVRGLGKGRYSFTGVASLNDEHTVFEFSIIVGEGTGPIPPIPPNPIPPNPNPPTPDTLYDSPIKLYIVEETAQRTVAMTKLLLDLTFWNDLEKQGYIMRPYDITSADAKRMGLDKIKDEKGNLRTTPFIVIVAKDGTVIGSYPLPLTREGIKAILPKVKVAAIKILEAEEAVPVYSPTQVPLTYGVPSYPFPQNPPVAYPAGTIPHTTAPIVVGHSSSYPASIGMVPTRTYAPVAVPLGSINGCSTTG